MKLKPDTIPPADLPLAFAGFWRRVLASVIDFCILALPTYYLAMVLGHNSELPLAEQTRDVWVNAFKGLALGLNWLYMAGMESSVRQATLGKLLVGITVTNSNGQRLTFYQATLRFFAKALSVVTLCIGYLLAAFTPKKQALHDFVAGTLVIQKR